jgi:hypothetical protein
MPYAPTPDGEYTLTFWGLFPYITIGIQAVCVIHILYTRNDYWWFFIVLFFPIIGGLFYIYHELYPDFRSGGFHAVLDRFKTKAGRIREAEERLEESDTIENRIALAHQLTEARRYDDALKTLGPCFEGMYKDDAYVLIELADIQFLRGDHGKTKETCMKILQKCPKDVVQHAKTLLARSHEALREDAQAEALYKEILPESSGEEVRYRYAELLGRTGREAEALRMLKIIFKNWKGSPALYKRHERPWYRAAKKLRRALETNSR